MTPCRVSQRHAVPRKRRGFSNHNSAALAMWPNRSGMRQTAARTQAGFGGFIEPNCGLTRRLRDVGSALLGQTDAIRGSDSSRLEAMHD